MNKIRDIFILTLAFSIAIIFSANLPMAGINIENRQAAIATDMKKDGWHWYLYKDKLGCLCTCNMCLLASNINDYYVTPWGNCYWCGNDIGWQFNKAKGKDGEKLVLPSQQHILNIDISRTYVRGDWKYFVEHLVPPGNKYHHQGHLYYRDIELQACNINDYYKTPFGRLYWTGEGEIRWSSSGWLRVPNSKFPIGQELILEDYNFIQ